MALLLHLASDKWEGVDFYCIFADVRKNTVKIDSLPLVCFCKHLAILPSPAPSVQTSFVYVFTPLPDLA